MTDDEDRWQAALSGAPSSAPTRRATRLERAIIIGALADTACLLAFVPVAHSQGWVPCRSR